ncbi:MAG: hypothetical protein FP816_01850 [Desulfobacteraceae bacterium]|nr:hypothetical protein [Desulfobacteraceae bacterium]
MHKSRIEYNSSIDALVATSKKLSIVENKFSLSSEEFYNRYSKGLLEDSAEFIEWANDYQHYLALYRNVERRLQNVA